MASENDICNLALSRIGHLTITSLTEGTPTSDLCNLHYAISRDAVLRAHPWNFAIRRAILAQDVTTPEFEFTYRFALPESPRCLRVIRTNWEAEGISGSAVYGFPGIMGYADASVPYRIEGRYLYCNETDVKIEYIAQITDTAQFDSVFVDLLAQRLSAEMAPRLTDTQAMAQAMWNIYNAKLQDARLNDAMEGSAREVVDLGQWLVARA
jgi:hypothetical protein